jgi:bud site selection protein 31
MDQRIAAKQMSQTCFDIRVPCNQAAAMAWRLRAKLRKAPEGASLLAARLEEFESKLRAATSAPVTSDAMNRELSWPVHRLHYQKNRYIFDQHLMGLVSDALLAYLVREKIADGPLMAMWRRPGYETLCSLAVITRSNMSFGTVGICRTPLKGRSVQIAPNVLTGCVCCVMGGGRGPVWWNDEVPDIVRARIVDIDPGKAVIVEELERNGNEPKIATEGIVNAFGISAANEVDACVDDDVSEREPNQVPHEEDSREGTPANRGISNPENATADLGTSKAASAVAESELKSVREEVMGRESKAVLNGDAEPEANETAISNGKPEEPGEAVHHAEPKSRSNSQNAGISPPPLKKARVD